MQIINGSVNRKLLWTLILMPKQKGTLTIPPIAFGVDKSNGLQVVVSKSRTSSNGAGTEDLFLQVTAEPKQSHVQAQIIYTVRVYVATNLTNASLSEPSLSDADAVIEKLGNDRRYETNHKGRHYQVVERRYAIFPQQSGKLSISPIVFNAQMIQASRYMSPFPQAGQTRRIQSRAIDINIKAIPTSQKGKVWLPAQNIQLQEEWPQQPPTFKVGEAITRTLTLTADGLTAAQLPEIVKDTPDGFKTYPDQAALTDQKHDQGITGTRVEKIAMIATRAGMLELPEIKIHWWNTKKQRAETVRIAKRKINITSTDGHTKPSMNNTTVKTPPQTQPGELKPPAAITTQKNTYAAYWPWLSLILACGWLATALFFWQKQRAITHRENTTRDNETTITMASRKQAEKKIRQACIDNNASAAKQALLNWGKALFADKEVNSLSELGARLGGEVEQHINNLNQALYSASATDWQGSALWSSIQRYDTTKQQTIKNQDSTALATLYPTHEVT